MKKSSKKARKFSTTKAAYIIPVIAIVILAGLLCLKITVWKKHPVSQAPTTSKKLTAQSNFTGGGTKTATKDTSDNTKISATDTNGSIANIPPSSQWTTSKDGSSIVVYEPANGALFNSGDALSGTAKSNTVFYELEDNISGVIAQGQANVVDGKYSVKFDFSTPATNGKLNIFNQADDGTESNNVSINVRFK